MTKVKVSVIIPNYNKAKFLPETLDSLLNQINFSWEAIIVDDGSTDNSEDICKKYASLDLRFKFLYRDRGPKGANTCRNIGLAKAKGDYVVFLDSDDILMAFCLNQRVHFLEENKELDFAIFPTGTFYKEVGDSNSFWKTKPKSNHLSAFLRHELPWNTSSPIWRKDYLQQSYGFNESYLRMQDVELHTRILMQQGLKYKIASKSKVDCYYRIDSNRKVLNAYQLLQNFTDGVILYTKDMQMLLRAKLNSNPHYLKALKGTIIVAVRQILYEYKEGLITLAEKEILLDKLFDAVSVNNLLKSTDKRILWLYQKGYEKKMYRLKGYNYTFKKIITTI